MLVDTILMPLIKRIFEINNLFVWYLKAEIKKYPLIRKRVSFKKNRILFKEALTYIENQIYVEDLDNMVFADIYFQVLEGTTFVSKVSDNDRETTKIISVDVIREGTSNNVFDISIEAHWLELSEEELLETLNNLVTVYIASMINEINEYDLKAIQYTNVERNSEYQTYLALKEKFEDQAN